MACETFPSLPDSTSVGAGLKVGVGGLVVETGPAVSSRIIRFSVTVGEVDIPVEVAGAGRLHAPHKRATDPKPAIIFLMIISIPGCFFNRKSLYY
jgi:hypothetical protein